MVLGHPGLLRDAVIAWLACIFSPRILARDAIACAVAKNARFHGMNACNMTSMTTMNMPHSSHSGPNHAYEPGNFDMYKGQTVWIEVHAVGGTAVLFGNVHRGATGAAEVRVRRHDACTHACVQTCTHRHTGTQLCHCLAYSSPAAEEERREWTCAVHLTNVCASVRFVSFHTCQPPAFSSARSHPALPSSSPAPVDRMRMIGILADAY